MSPLEKQKEDYFDSSEQVTFRLPTAEFQNLTNSLKWKQRCNTKDTNQVLNGKKKHTDIYVRGRKGSFLM